MKKRIIFLFSIVILVSLSTIVMAEDSKEKTADEQKVQLELPLVDAPFNYQDGFYLPSMNQSLKITKDYFKLGLMLLDKTMDKLNLKGNSSDQVFWRGMSYILFAVESSRLPGADGWLHEEYHRAVLKNKGIDSYNGIYDLKGGEFTSVSEIDDQELAQMKAESNPDFVRLAAAGYEAQTELVLSLEKEKFFYNPRYSNGYRLTYWMDLFNNYDYLNACTDESTDEDVEEMIEEEGADMSKKDFTGLDFTAWVHDLFNPDVDYNQDRGYRQNGGGIDRYIRVSELSSEEMDYLNKQRRLAMLNALDPMLFGIDEFRLNENLAFNVNVRHYLTSFGSSVNLNFYLKKDDLKLFMSLLNQSNYKNYFPGIDLQLIDYPITFKDKKIKLTPRLMLWSQPKDQKFKTSQGEFGALLSVKLSTVINDKWGWNLKVAGKTDGWVASNVYLDQNISLQTGLTYSF
ncbi:hypothetical protein BX659_12543 [Orenia metallireducens]|uniref:Uncharacterized protein n=1 Tax=Orenia metallireducens TaxID=1413210 RepID=A0A285HTA3_9FIRM|nr:hypothetical protein [Orenia metallireducens]PRX24080.1 hypothetical protein BX659_12543 [Orenia metallireducens]SNY38944.1 hypothetical protein SAMN06265827_12444 [Orenia metallireducens]